MTTNLGPRITGHHHYALLEHCAKQATGTAIEFGVGTGQSTRILATHMPVIGFDSFRGLPEDWRPEYPKGSFATEPPVIDGVTLVKGMISRTLPHYDFTSLDIGLVHFDLDLYKSTATALKHIGPHLRENTIVVFDEYHSYDDGDGARAEDHEQKAWREHLHRTGLKVIPIGHDFEQAAFQCV